MTGAPVAEALALLARACSGFAAAHLEEIARAWPVVHDDTREEIRRGLERAAGVYAASKIPGAGVARDAYRKALAAVEVR